MTRETNSGGTSDPVLIGQLTDTHVLAVGDIETETLVDNNARLAEAVASIDAEPLPLDVVIGSGDLTNDGRAAEYDALEELLGDLATPFLALPGNHDERDELRRRFPSTPWADTEHASWCVDVRAVRVVGLDSTRPDRHGGEFDGERAEWLDAALADSHDRVTLLVMHHPPFESGIWWMDRDGFPGLGSLAEIVRAHRVDRILCGHLHRPMSSAFAGVPAQVAPSTVQHVALDLRADGLVAVADEPVGYQIHTVRGADVVTHVRMLGAGPAVVPSWADKYA